MLYPMSRESDKLTTFLVTCSKGLHAMLKARAKANDRSVTAEVRVILQAAVAPRKEEK